MSPRAWQVFACLIAFSAPASAEFFDAAGSSSLDGWKQCVRGHAHDLARLKTSDPAETLIRAALAECKAQESAYSDEMARRGVSLKTRIDEIATEKQWMLEDLLAGVIRAKAAK